MLVTSIVLFVVAALGGVVLAAVRARSNANPPTWLAVVHGLIAAAGLVTLVAFLAGNGWPTLPLVGAGLLVLAAAGGFTLFASQLRGGLISMTITVVHAVAAACGLFVLILAAAGAP